MAGTAGASMQIAGAEIDQRFEDVATGYNIRELDRQKEAQLREFQDRKTMVQKQVSQILGQQKVAYAAQGIELDSGVAAEVAKDSIRAGTEDVINLRNNAWKGVFGIESQSLSLMIQSSARRQGRKLRGQAQLFAGLASDAEKGIKLAGGGG